MSKYKNTSRKGKPRSNRYKHEAQKVLLSILGNHQGAGFANFTDYASADAFAADLEQVVKTYGLDGIDFDDEYAEYGKKWDTSTK